MSWSFCADSPCSPIHRIYVGTVIAQVKSKILLRLPWGRVENGDHGEAPDTTTDGVSECSTALERTTASRAYIMNITTQEAAVSRSAVAFRSSNHFHGHAFLVPIYLRHCLRDALSRASLDTPLTHSIHYGFCAPVRSNPAADIAIPQQFATHRR